MLSLDTETTGLDPYDPDFRVFMVQIADAHGEYVWDENTGWDGMLEMLATDDMLVLANASYDIHALREAGIVDIMNGRWRVHDVQTLARVAIPGRFSYRLEDLGTALLGADATEAQRMLKEAAKRHGLSWTQKDKDYYGLWLAEPELLERYGKEDVRLTHDLWLAIWARASAADREVYKLEIAGVAPILRNSEKVGVLVDQAKLAVLEDTLVSERDELRQKLLQAGMRDTALGVEIPDEDTDDPDAPVEYGKSTPAHLREDLLRLGVPLYKLTKSSGTPKMLKGAPVMEKYTDDEGNERLRAKIHPDTLAVDKDALSEFERTHPVVADLLAWRNRCKILQTYVGPLKLADPRVHTSFNQCAARTSRMSSSRPNMQNLPTPDRERADGTRPVGVRDVLIPGPGMAFMAADFDSIEVRVLAYYIANRELIEALDSGVDMHQRTAYLVAVAKGEQGVTLETFVKGGPRDKDRTIAKVTTFTVLYGGGVRLLAVRLGVSLAEAAAIRDAVLNAIPGYWAFDEKIKRTVSRRSFPHVTTITGRRLHVPKDKPYVACNTLIQGTSAELMKLAMIAAAPVLDNYGWGVRLVVHDELLSEGPAACVEDCMRDTVSAMESCFPLSPRLVVSADWSTESYGAAK